SREARLLHPRRENAECGAKYLVFRSEFRPPEFRVRGEPAMAFQESAHPKPIPLTTLIRDLGAQIAGSWLEPVLEEFHRELEQKGMRHGRRRFYLSTEWGVPFDTTAIALPFYLARHDLIALYAEHAGRLEGASRPELLRYLRHEMGHAVNYGYQLYKREDW